MSSYGAAPIGTGSYVPEKVLTNTDLEEFVETSDEWIRTRTGIHERRIAADDEPTSTLGAKAAEHALHAADIDASQLDLIIVATLSPDTPFPNTGCHLQRQIQAMNAACFSIEAACSGFLFALETAANFLRNGMYKHVLVVGAEKMSSVVNWQDRSTCVLFGDGAGAVVLSRVPAEHECLLASEMGSNGHHSDLLYIPAGGSAQPVTPEAMEKGLHYLHMNGREIFKLAVGAMADACSKVLSQAGTSSDQIRWLIPHQANTRILASVGKRLGVPPESVFMNLHKYGNTSAATIPLCLDEVVRNNQVDEGEHLLLTAFGGGLTWGAQLLRWPHPAPGTPQNDKTN